MIFKGGEVEAVSWLAKMIKFGLVLSEKFWFSAKSDPLRAPAHPPGGKGTPIECSLRYILL